MSRTLQDVRSTESIRIPSRQYAAFLHARLDPRFSHRHQLRGHGSEIICHRRIEPSQERCQPAVPSLGETQPACTDSMSSLFPLVSAFAARKVLGNQSFTSAY